MSHPDVYPMLMGDANEEVYTDPTDEDVSLTRGYIAAVACGRSTDSITSSPILHVLTRRTGFEAVMHADHEKIKDHQKVKLTHLTLVDGDNNQIHSRMATHIADAGRELSEGDIIKLERFTELSYRVNKTSNPMPALFILNYTHVGHMPLDPQKEINDMIPYQPTLAALEDKEDSEEVYHVIDPLTQDPPKCTYENRLCRKFGVNFIGRCICEEIPVEERDLEVIAEDCHLINKPASELKENKPKRLMLYWWYATNIYSLNGKGHRGKLPDCLEYAIKAAYPEKDSADWTGYKPGTKKAGKKSDIDWCTYLFMIDVQVSKVCRTTEE